MLFENFYFFFYVYWFTPNVDQDWFKRFVKDGKLSIINGKWKSVPVKEIDMVKNLLKEYPKIKNIYDETSKFVHFSNKHLFNFTENTYLEWNNQYFSMKIWVWNEYWVQWGEFDNYVSAAINIDSEMKKFLIGSVNFLIRSNNKKWPSEIITDE
jgi:hypothetical protein